MGYIQAKNVYILIHGTWAADSTWYRPGGVFFETLSKMIQVQDSILAFRWSGGLSCESRVQAGNELALLLKSYPDTIKLHLIGHSHGVNVGMLAINQLTLSRPIQTFYSLGVPIYAEYAPNMNIINELYNIFSLNDWIQPIGGVCKRMYDSHPRIVNIRLTIDDHEPNHSELCCEIVARWLLSFPKFLRVNEGSGAFLRTDPHVSLCEQNFPLIEDDVRRLELLERNAYLINKIYCSGFLFRK
ncbi:MAG: hypothetical protein WBQ73_00695 [Candidatus Babeliales bacterium]